MYQPTKKGIAFIAATAGWTLLAVVAPQYSCSAWFRTSDLYKKNEELRQQVNAVEKRSGDLEARIIRAEIIAAQMTLDNCTRYDDLKTKTPGYIAPFDAAQELTKAHQRILGLKSDLGSSPMSAEMKTFVDKELQGELYLLQEHLLYHKGLRK